MRFQKRFIPCGELFLQRVILRAGHQHAVAAEQPLHLRRHARRIRAFPVGLVEKDQRGNALLSEQLEKRHRVALHAFRAGHDQQRRIQHGQCALHFSGKIDVSRRIHQRDEERLAVLRAPLKRRLLGKDGDAARAFHRVVVHKRVAVVNASAGSDHARPAEHLFAKGRLARVNVRRHAKGQVHVVSSAGLPFCSAASSSSRIRSRTASTTFC